MHGHHSQVGMVLSLDTAARRGLSIGAAACRLG